MKPEDLDKLFNERLGNRNPTPSANLWNRLQNKIEEELPAKEEKKPILMWARTYAAAAAVTVLLSAGVVFYNVQQDARAPSETLAQVEQAATLEDEAEPASTGKWVKERAAVADEQRPAAPVSEENIAAVNASIAQTPEIVPDQKSEQPVAKKQKSASIEFDNRLVAAAGSKKVKQAPVQEQAAIPETPVSFASAKTDMNAAPVEIIIKRAVATNTPEDEMRQEPVSDFKKKQTLVKNIFKQIKNLSNGEQVNLSAVGLHADRIALETQIGKQKISKVIHL